MTQGSFAIGWRQVGSSFVLLACTAAIAASFSVIAIPLAEEFHPSRALLLMATTLVSGVSALLAPLCGILMDRTSVRHLVILGGLLLGGGLVAVSFARTFDHVLWTYAALIAPANVLLGPLAATVLLSRWFVNRRGRALGIAIAGISMGGVIFPPMAHGFLTLFPWREGLRLFALVLGGCAILAGLLIVNRPAERGLFPDGAACDPEAGVAQTAKGAMWQSIWKMISDPTFWMIFLMVGTVTGGMIGMVSNLALLGRAEGAAPGAAALLISFYAGGSLIAKLCFATFSDRINLRYLAMIGLLGFALGFLILAQAQLGYPVMVAGAMITGLFGGMIVPLESLLGARVFGREAVGRAVGLLNMATLVVLLAAPLFFGRIFDISGNYDGALYTFAALAVGATLVVPFVRLHPREHAAVGLERGAGSAAATRSV